MLSFKTFSPCGRTLGYKLLHKPSRSTSGREAHSYYVLNEQQSHFRAVCVAITQYDAGGLDLKVFVNCRVQGTHSPCPSFVCTVDATCALLKGLFPCLSLTAAVHCSVDGEGPFSYISSCSCGDMSCGDMSCGDMLRGGMSCGGMSHGGMSCGDMSRGGIVFF